MLSRNPAPFFKHHVITGYAIYILVTSHKSSSSKTKEKKNYSRHCDFSSSISFSSPHKISIVFVRVFVLFHDFSQQNTIHCLTKRTLQVYYANAIKKKRSICDNTQARRREAFLHNIIMVVILPLIHKKCHTSVSAVQVS